MYRYLCFIGSIFEEVLGSSGRDLLLFREALRSSWCLGDRGGGGTLTIIAKIGVQRVLGSWFGLCPLRFLHYLIHGHDPGKGCVLIKTAAEDFLARRNGSSRQDLQHCQSLSAQTPRG
jgi:hypothetical protein